MIDIRNIHKKYDNLEVLRGIDLHIPDHEIVTIVGASGAGKTTLLQIMGTLEKPTEGSVFFDGKRVDNLSDHEMAHSAIRTSALYSSFISFCPNLQPWKIS